MRRKNALTIHRINCNQRNTNHSKGVIEGKMVYRKQNHINELPKPKELMIMIMQTFAILLWINIGIYFLLI